MVVQVQERMHRYSGAGSLIANTPPHLVGHATYRFSAKKVLPNKDHSHVQPPKRKNPPQQKIRREGFDHSLLLTQQVIGRSGPQLLLCRALVLQPYPSCFRRSLAALVQNHDGLHACEHFGLLLRRIWT